MGLVEEFADPEFARRLREAYRGRHDIRDAVWWRESPADRGPSGAESPATEVARLGPQVYSRTGASAEVTAAHAAAVAAIERDRVDLDAAVAAARAPRPLSQDTVDAYPDERSGSRFLVIALVAVVVAAIGGAWVDRQLSPTSAPEAPVTVTATPSPLPTSAALSIFERDQVESDVPTVSSMSDLTYDSFRLISVIPETPAEGEIPNDELPDAAKLYAARTTAHRACVVAVRKKHVVGAACAVEKEFPINGLQLSFTAGSWLYQVDWRDDGSLGFGYSATPN